MPSVAALFNAYRQFYEQPDDLRLATRFISNRLLNSDSVILVAESEDGHNRTLTGFCQLYPGFCSVLAKPIYTLYDLFVAPGARKTGAGRALLLAAHEHARTHGFARLDLSTAKNNHAAQALYESLGWVRDEVYFSYSKAV
ncbi:N-acetyltransferase [Polaromonas sp.]|uniref:GNAT family N-acetyltransferase n=1 Tax=Polaromonas sp. TaxID=1869339 RepID=UPI0025E71E36|nr:GNAT family N-acetyltransferase [Polaromonas sp.]